MSTLNAQSLKRIVRLLRHARLAFLALFGLTVGLLVWQHYGMERVVLVNGKTALDVNAQGDTESKGASTVRLVRDGERTRMYCKLVQKFAWPYCRLQLVVGSGSDGMDMTRFDRISLDLRHEGPGPHLARLALVNVEPGLSTPGDWESYKVNEVDVVPVPDQGDLVLPLDVFFTANWWKIQRNIPVARSAVRIDNVVSIDLTTAVGNAMGDHVLTLNGIRLHGKWISQRQLLMVLVGFWILFAISLPTMAALSLRDELETNKTQLRLLAEINQALEIEARELVGQAHFDPLTGALNRQGLRASLMNTSSMLADPFSVIFMDIDHFKAVNDTHGHETGDVVLRQFAHHIDSRIRASDRLVRWGGEEFLIVCTNSDLQQAAGMAEKLRASLHEQTWPQQLQVTASFGVAQHFPAEEIKEVIQRADQALYAAKTGGRDRVHC